MKKPSEPYKLKIIFAEIWSRGYNGEVYQGSTRDLRSAKEYLELNPDFFENEQSQIIFRERAKKYVEDKFWFKPFGTPPMFHPMYAFLNNVEKYVDAVKREQSDPELVKICDSCGREMRAKRSHWMKWKNQTIKCGNPNCGNSFNVNDVINQITKLSDILR